MFWCKNDCSARPTLTDINELFNSFLASGDFCHLLITFANSLDPDQNVGPDLDQNCLSLCRALNHLILGPKFSPIPNAKKYVFFSIPDKKFQFDKKK